MRIALVGYMGSGKTTVGQHLAERLKLSFIDLDTEIEKRERKTITEIFSRHGESEFRRIESEVLHQVLSETKSGIIATGGGTPCFFNQMQELNSHCMTIYLECSTASLLNRLSESAKERPLLSSIKSIEVHLQERQPIYASAHHIVSGDDSVTAILSRIEQIVLQT